MTVKKFFRYAIPALLVFTLVPLVAGRRAKAKFEPRDLRCVMELKGYRSGIMSYDVGFNYEMLKQFSHDMNCSTHIVLRDTSGAYIDSLLEGSIDILVIPSRDFKENYKEDFNVSIPLKDSTIWMSRANDRPLSKEINKWLSATEVSEYYDIALERFTNPGSAYRKRGKYKVSTPYDDLLKKYASKINWDWRLLAALIWTESKFHIEAKSPRGAIGLMQIVPSGKTKASGTELLDPEESIEKGVRYLSRLQNMFSGVASGKELIKFTLGAYNAGEGRIMDCINYARSIGAPTSRWSDIVNMIPSMRDDTINDVDTVKLGVFKGYETMRYVIKVTDLYEDYCYATGHVPSWPDQPSTQKDTVSSTKP